MLMVYDIDVNQGEMNSICSNRKQISVCWAEDIEKWLHLLTTQESWRIQALKALWHLFSVVMVTRVCPSVSRFLKMHFKWVHFIVCKLFPSKVDF
jgi:hypothetical protein